MTLQDNTQYAITERGIVVAKFLLKRDYLVFYDYLKNIKINMDTIKVYHFDKEIDTIL